MEDLVVEGRVSKWILNRMRVCGLDPTASGKEVERRREHAEEVTIPYAAQKLVTSRKTNYLLKKNHVPVPNLFSHSVSQLAS